MDPSDVDNLDELLKGLKGDPPPLDMGFLDEPQDAPEEAAPQSNVVELSQWRRRMWAMGGLLAAAGALFAIWPADSVQPGDGSLRVRGDATDGPVGVELRLMVRHNDNLERLTKGAAVSTGDRVYFRIQADRPTTVHVWADQDGDHTPIGQLHARPEATELTGASGGAVGWAFDTRTSVTFFASSAGPETCPPDACDRWTVDVQ